MAAFHERRDLEGKPVVMCSGNMGLYCDLPNILGIVAGFKDCGDAVCVLVGGG